MPSFDEVVTLEEESIFREVEYTGEYSEEFIEAIERVLQVHVESTAVVDLRFFTRCQQFRGGHGPRIIFDSSWPEMLALPNSWDGKESWLRGNCRWIGSADPGSIYPCTVEYSMSSQGALRVRISVSRAAEIELADAAFALMEVDPACESLLRPRDSAAFLFCDICTDSIREVYSEATRRMPALCRLNAVEMYELRTVLGEPIGKQTHDSLEELISRFANRGDFKRIEYKDPPRTPPEDDRLRIRWRERSKE